jgi:hypothetical protein
LYSVELCAFLLGYVEGNRRVGLVADHRHVARAMP